MGPQRKIQEFVFYYFCLLAILLKPELMQHILCCRNGSVYNLFPSKNNYVAQFRVPDHAKCMDKLFPLCILKIPAQISALL